MDKRDIVVIGGSRGAFGVLRRLARKLPPDLPAAVCVVLHVGRHDSILPHLMSEWGPIPASHPDDGEAVANGRIYIAPPDRHLRLSHGRFRLDDSAAENFARPAADPLFRSAALDYGTRVVAVVLSGDLDDGAAGLATVRARGGYAIVQDPADCEAPSMPRSALAAAGADMIASAEEIAARIIAAVAGAQRKGPTPMPTNNLELEARIAQRDVVQPEDLDQIGERSPLTCPECGGTLWRILDDHPLRYRCHTGHAFNAHSLEDGHERSEENAIWTAIRAVNERIILARERQKWAERVGDASQMEIEKARLDEASRLVETLRRAFPSTSQ
ncbi:chemotaxis protein CheB [Paraburkholderia lycopersici]|uniref:protein-glutamate methylesterase n=1 Tax=Paraburkholderia lycopersici TaxID=416944 RepID=A0A1G6TGP3_9BURK|nr:chemotaxis protein CheB [Paraburkholderia lycopersici]SDD27597.1 two-component system, chemotaxis family, response regulator CheB [Paraburkholderia lycopersici]